MTNNQFLQEVSQVENLLFSFALRLTRSRADAEDLMQETKIKAYQYRDKFRLGTNFKSWVSTIMRNTFINHYRKRKSRRHLNQPVDDITYTLESKQTVNNEAEQSLRLRELNKMMNSIGKIYSVPFRMFYEGYEYKEIAEHLNIPIGTVKSRIFLARTKMKGMIGERIAA
ncbi:hypothetical protein CEQ90_01215 [Lewinellaceae bacterium SD302]|nr:hypothetical protein CEQ90_01215 [Lewinellaceae bacterium SD302]